MPSFATVCVAALVSASPPVEVAPPPRPLDPSLAEHLTAWKVIAAGRTNVRAEVALTRTDPVLKRGTNFSGRVLCMKPNFAVLRLDNAGDPTKADYEAYIWNGRSVFAYSGSAKTVTELPMAVRPPWPFHRVAEAGATLALGHELLLGANPLALRGRFDMTLVKSDDHYVYFDLKPQNDRDRAAFQRLRLAVYGPGPDTAKLAYLPAQVDVLRPDNSTDVWKFTNPEVNLPGVERKHFQYVEVPGWKVQRLGANGAEPPPIPEAKP